MRTPELKPQWLAWAVLATLFLGVPVFAQTNPANPEMRECEPGFEEPLVKKKTNKKSKAFADLPAASQVCLETRTSALSIQERLQKFVRAERWNISDEQISEDTWTFSLLLSKDELISYTKPPELPKIAWHGGKGWIQVRTVELPDGFTRAVISSRFDGYGKSEDQFAAQRESWPLPSSGILESLLVAELKLPAAVPSSQLQN